MRIAAIDPGPERSAIVVYDWERTKIHLSYTVRNLDMLGLLALEPKVTSCHRLTVEMIASYGMPVGAEVFETCVWIGRFVERWKGPSDFTYRRDVKLELCKDARAKDSNVRQALLDRFGGKDKAIGKKASPGPLYAVKGDQWAALAVAVTWCSKHGRALAEAMSA